MKFKKKYELCACESGRFASLSIDSSSDEFVRYEAWIYT